MAKRRKSRFSTLSAEQKAFGVTRTERERNISDIFNRGKIVTQNYFSRLPNMSRARIEECKDIICFMQESNHPQFSSAVKKFDSSVRSSREPHTLCDLTLLTNQLRSALGKQGVIEFEVWKKKQTK